MVRTGLSEKRWKTGVTSTCVTFHSQHRMQIHTNRCPLNSMTMVGLSSPVCSPMLRGTMAQIIIMHKIFVPNRKIDSEWSFLWVWAWVCMREKKTIKIIFKSIRGCSVSFERRMKQRYDMSAVHPKTLHSNDVRIYKILMYIQKYLQPKTSPVLQYCTSICDTEYGCACAVNTWYLF